MADDLIPRDKQKLIYIQWLDAHTSGGWHSENQLKDFINYEDCVCENVGWVVGEDGKNITLACRRMAWSYRNRPDEDEYGLLQKIPKTWIKKRKHLKLP